MKYLCIKFIFLVVFFSIFIDVASLSLNVNKNILENSQWNFSLEISETTKEALIMLNDKLLLKVYAIKGKIVYIEEKSDLIINYNIKENKINAYLKPLVAGNYILKAELLKEETTETIFQEFVVYGVLKDEFRLETNEKLVTLNKSLEQLSKAIEDLNKDIFYLGAKTNENNENLDKQLKKLQSYLENIDSKFKKIEKDYKRLNSDTEYALLELDNIKKSFNIEKEYIGAAPFITLDYNVAIVGLFVILIIIVFSVWLRNKREQTLFSTRYFGHTEDEPKAGKWTYKEPIFEKTKKGEGKIHFKDLIRKEK